MTKNLHISKKSSTFASSKKKTNNSKLTIMKKINYSRVFTQKLRQNNVFGIFCEYASETMMSCIYSKRDMWIEDGKEGVHGMVASLIKEVEKDGKFEEAKLMRNALLTANEIRDITEKY